MDDHDNVSPDDNGHISPAQGAADDNLGHGKITEMTPVNEGAVEDANKADMRADIDSIEKKIMMEDIGESETDMAECFNMLTKLDDDKESARLINLMASKGWNPNYKDATGDTPLQTMIKSNRQSCALALLTAKADVNRIVLDDAIKIGNPDILQTLIAFGADLRCIYLDELHLTDGPNKERILELMLAAGAKPTKPKESGRLNKLFASKMSSVAHKLNLLTRTGERVLCLDGGGMRGLILVAMLREVEKVVGRPIQDCFDWIGGTSTGGILALALAQGKDLDACQSLYLDLKNKVFSGRRPYSTKNIERSLKHIYGDTTKMSDLQNHKIVVTAVKADTVPPEQHLYRNYVAPDTDDKYLPENVFAWQAARASSAAPTYFRPYEIFLDGGLLANNPTLDVIREIRRHNMELFNRMKHGGTMKKVSVVVSLGTGLTRTKPADVPDAPATAWQALWNISDLKNLSQLVLSNLTMPDGLTERRARECCEMQDIKYFRFTPELSDELELDCVDSQKLMNMMCTAQQYVNIKENADQVQQLKLLLDR